jgi:diaminohydroxyphosphoribosylaminopyrimidine deaminase/5-amino-6-(5-phosphoribosylamino)uracil reductase
LLEGGATLAGSALREDLIDQLQVFVAPKLIGGDSANGIFSGNGCERLMNAVRLSELRHEQISDDILLTGEVERCSQG